MDSQTMSCRLAERTQLVQVVVCPLVPEVVSPSVMVADNPLVLVAESLYSEIGVEA